MKKNRLWGKLALDLGMLLVFVLLLRKNNFGLAFHEVAGLAVAAAFLIHILLNWRWVAAVTGKLFSRKLSPRARLGWLVDLGLLLCFGVIVLTGIRMSRFVFSGMAAGAAQGKVLHYFCSALALILLGIHLGLHASMVGNALKKVLPSRAAAGICILLTVALVLLGCWSLYSTSFCRWLTMPVQLQGDTGRLSGGLEAGVPDSNDSELPERPGNGSGEAGHGAGKGMGSGYRGGKGDMPEGFRDGQGSDQGSHGGEGTGLPQALWSGVQFFSIVYLIAAAAWGLEWLLRRRKKAPLKP